MDLYANSLVYLKNKNQPYVTSLNKEPAVLQQKVQ